MTTDNAFILFKKTDFNTILACLGVRCIGDGGATNFCRRNRGGHSFMTLTWKLWDLPSEENGSSVSLWIVQNKVWTQFPLQW